MNVINVSVSEKLALAVPNITGNTSQSKYHTALGSLVLSEIDLERMKWF